MRGGHVSEEDRSAALERLAFTTSLDDVEGADAAIEAIIEDEGLKRELFKRLDALLPDAQFLASNTSSVPIMKLGAETSQPHKVIGLHFFNPVPVLPLVEIVHSIMTADETADAGSRVRRGDAGQGVHRLPGPRRLRGQRAADPVPAVGDPDVRVGLRLARGHRPRDGARAARTRWGRCGCPT